MGSRGCVGPRCSASSSIKWKHEHSCNACDLFPKEDFLLVIFLWLCNKAPGSTMSITHIVLFQFKPGVDAQVIKDVWIVWAVVCRNQLTESQVCTRMLGLKDNCLHPSSSKPYIKTSSGGADNSPEGIQVSSHTPRDYFTRKKFPVSYVRTMLFDKTTRTVSLMPSLLSLKMQQIETTIARKIPCTRSLSAA